MRAVLEAHRKAAVVRVEELEAELVPVRTDLADAEEVLGRRVIGLEQYLEALAEEEAPGFLGRLGGGRSGCGMRCRTRRTRTVSGTSQWTTRRWWPPPGRRSRGAGCPAGGGGAGDDLRLPCQGREGPAELLGNGACWSRRDRADSCCPQRSRALLMVDGGGQAATHEGGHRPPDDGVAGWPGTVVCREPRLTKQTCLPRVDDRKVH